MRSPILADLERSVSPTEATELTERVRQAFLTQQGLSIKAEPIGGGPHMCTAARNSLGEVIAAGFGKGHDEKVGSFGECIEHLHLSEVAGDPIRFSCLVQTSTLRQSDVFFRVGHSLNTRGDPIYAIPHSAIDEDQRLDFVPASMFGLRTHNDEFIAGAHETFFSRYSSSSGTAFGFSPDDALLHAVLEVVERHEISRVFIHAIDQTLEDSDLALLSDYAYCPETSEAAAALPTQGALAPVRSLVRRNEFGAYFAFSFTRAVRQGVNSLIWGAGCSLFRDVAVNRSVTECEQSLRAPDFPREDDQLATFARIYPRFGAIDKLSTSALRIPQVRFSSDEQPAMSVGSQLAMLISQIRATGRFVLCFWHPQVDDCYRVVSTYVSNMEKFFGVIFANPVLPIEYLLKFADDLDADASRNGGGAVQPIVPRDAAR